MMLLVAAVLAVAPMESDAASLLSGAAEVLESSEPSDTGAWALLDGNLQSTFETEVGADPARVIIKLAHLTRLSRVGVGSAERSGNALVEVHGSAVPDGRWRPLASSVDGVAEGRFLYAMGRRRGPRR